MKTKADIVQRLLDERHITAEEATVLLQEKQSTFPTLVPPPIGVPAPTDEKVPYYEICSCNPENGGNGICGCVIGNQLVYPPGKATSNFIHTDNTDKTYDGVRTYYVATDTTGVAVPRGGCSNAVCFCTGACRK